MRPDQIKLIRDEWEKTFNTEFIQIEQDPDMTDSEMMTVIRDRLAEGWGLVEYKWEAGVRTWVFQK